MAGLAVTTNSSLNWICDSRKLKILRLDKCPIIRYFRVPRSVLSGAGVPQDWEELDSQAWEANDNVALFYCQAHGIPLSIAYERN